MNFTQNKLSHTGGNFAKMIREMGLYEREVIMYSKIVEHFRHILSQRGKQVREKRLQRTVAGRSKWMH